MDKEVIEQLGRFFGKREEIQFAILFGSMRKHSIRGGES